MKKYKSDELYPDIYALRPDYEIERGWWKLKWRPLWKKTFSFYLVKGRSDVIAIRCGRNDARNGWGRYYKRFDFALIIFGFEPTFWVKWDYRVMADGPSDGGESVPLNLNGRASYKLNTGGGLNDN